MHKKYKEKIFTAGKINLYLNVKKGLRKDSFHEIKSIMQSISLFDELDFEAIPRDKHRQKNIPGFENGISITSNEIELPLGAKNIVHKAALLMLERDGLKDDFDIKINIHKSIPLSAGLAGGSSNAAATLVALDRMFDINISRKELLDIAGQIGSDVPFCLYGGTIFTEGKGELLTRLPDIPFYWVIIASDGKKFLSREVYEKFDLVGKEKKSNHLELINYLKEKKYDSFFLKIANDLESAVIGEDDSIRNLKKIALSSGAFAVQMTGSGPTIFCFCDDLSIARNVRDKLKKITDIVFLTHTTYFSLSFAAT